MDESKVIMKGRLGPGMMIAVHLPSGQVCIIHVAYTWFLYMYCWYIYMSHFRNVVFEQSLLRKILLLMDLVKN